MKNIMQVFMKLFVSTVLGFVFMYFMLSFCWSASDMSSAEKITGIVYCMLVLPLYYGLMRVTGLR